MQRLVGLEVKCFAMNTMLYLLSRILSVGCQFKFKDLSVQGFC